MHLVFGVWKVLGQRMVIQLMDNKHRSVMDHFLQMNIQKINAYDVYIRQNQNTNDVYNQFTAGCEFFLHLSSSSSLFNSYSSYLSPCCRRCCCCCFSCSFFFLSFFDCCSFFDEWRSKELIRNFFCSIMLCLTIQTRQCYN